jgi:hypothetical protein
VEKEKASLTDIAPELPVGGHSDARANDEWTQTFSTKKTKPQLQNERYHLQTSIIRDEHNRRWRVLVIGFVSVALWMLGTLGVVACQGFAGGQEHPFFRIDEKVLLAFLGIGAVHMLGLLLVAAKYVFPNRPWWLRRAYDSSGPKPK